MPCCYVSADEGDNISGALVATGELFREWRRREIGHAAQFIRAAQRAAIARKSTTTGTSYRRAARRSSAAG